MYYLIYSCFRPDSSTEYEIQSILETSKENNAKQNITGILLYSETKFVQYLEGDKDKLEALYLKIKADKRQTGAMKLVQKPLDRRLFPSWAMAHKKMDSNNIELLESNLNDYKKAVNDNLKSEDYPLPFYVVRKISGLNV